jgi:hypothetical protein
MSRKLDIKRRGTELIIRHKEKDLQEMWCGKRSLTGVQQLGFVP